jgi:hypothetical protein
MTKIAHIEYFNPTIGRFGKPHPIGTGDGNAFLPVIKARLE